MCDFFEDEVTSAGREVTRLKGLLKDVCWYNFETKCRGWMHPWPKSVMESWIALHGVCIEVDKSRGREREIGKFPVYYAGPISDAPALPPEIILKELLVACKYKKEAEEQRAAPFDWAPGGKKYNQLLKETNVPTEASKKRARDSERISRQLAESHGARI